MAHIASVFPPEPSILDKLDRVSPGARAEILSLANIVDAARQEADSSLTGRFTRLCRKGLRNLATAHILSAGPYGMGAVNPHAIDYYNQARAQNAAEDHMENDAAAADACRFAILTYMRKNCIHGSMLDLTPRETASLAMTLPNSYRRLSTLCP